MTQKASATDEIAKIIEDTITSSITSFFSGKEVTTLHVLDHIFPKERKIRSLIGGLETSMGTRVWEPLAKSFAQHNDFVVHNEKKFNTEYGLINIPDEASGCLTRWRAQREAKTESSLSGYIDEIRSIAAKYDQKDLQWGKISKGHGIDLWIEKEGKEYIYDIKTNQLNAGGGQKHSENVMRWYLYRLFKNPDVDISCQIAFPFNPHAPTDYWKKETGKVLPLEPKVDAVVENEFWNFLLGQEDSWNLITSAFIKIGGSGFSQKFESLFNE